METRPFHARYRFATLVLTTLLAFPGINGCESAATDTSLLDGGSENASDDAKLENTAVISGRLDDGIGNTENAQILIFRVQPDGILQDITAGDAHSDDKGRFKVSANIANPPLSNLIVEARTMLSTQEDKDAKLPTRLASALLIQELKSGESATTPPLDFETTLEADIYVQAQKLRQWNEHSDAAQLRILITPQIAAAARDGGHYDDQVKTLVQITTTAMNAFSTTLLNDPAFKYKESPDGVREMEPGYRNDGIRKAFSKEDIQNARKDFRKDYERFDNRLNDQTRPSAQNRVRLELANAQVQAYTDNNIDIHTVARANQAFSEAALAIVPALAPKTQAATTAAVENQRARFVTRSIQSDIDTVGISNENVIAIEQAGQDLRRDLLDLSDLSGDISNEAHNLWQAYRQNVETRLQTSFTIQQRQVLTQMQSNIVPAARTMFSTFDSVEPQINDTTTAHTTADAVLLFHKDTAVLAYSDLWKDANINYNRATALLEILLTFATIR